MTSELVTAQHLCRKAMIYIRQSTPNQVVNNQESLRLQYALRQRASDLGWEEANIEVIDVDLGLSGSTLSHREGFKDVIARVTLGEVGIILSYEVTRLARNCTDWYPLLDLCGFRQCLIGDRDGVYDPGSANGRLLLGLKGTISEVELHTLRGRLTAGLLNKAKRGELALLLPAGFERDTNGIVHKDPNQEVQDRVSLIFTTFLDLGSVGKVMRRFRDHALTLPRRDRFGDVVWRAPTAGMLTAILKNPAYAGAFVYGRTRSCHSTYANGKLITERCPMSEWKIVVKDRYPVYLVLFRSYSAWLSRSMAWTLSKPSQSECAADSYRRSGWHSCTAPPSCDRIARTRRCPDDQVSREVLAQLAALWRARSTRVFSG